MPRKARQKHPHAIFHIMCRSISEFLLFRDDSDKEYYLALLQRYTQKYQCSIYAYCLMDNHLHLHLDPRGFDVSKFMHCVNTAYVRYYNIKYQRHGSVFQGRFESRILDTDEYNLAVSAYIHNNPQDVEGFCGKEETYKYSSYGVYLGIRKDMHRLVDMSFVMGIFHTPDREKFIQRYFAFVSHQRDVGSFKELKKKLSNTIEYEYKSGRRVLIREISPAQVMSRLWNRLLMEDKCRGPVKKKKVSEWRAITAYALQMLCGLGYKEICNTIYNITISGCARLCSRGYELVKSKHPTYASLLAELAGCMI